MWCGLCLWMVMVLLAGSGFLAHAATSKQYVVLEPPILFADLAQAEDATWTLAALPNNQGRISNRFDRGTTAHAALYKWRCTFQATAAVAVGTTVEIYASTSDGTDPDGQVGTADAALATDKRQNLLLLGVLIADQTAANIDMTTSGIVFIPDRFISLGVWNALGVAFRNDTLVHGCTLTPIPLEQQ